VYRKVPRVRIPPSPPFNGHRVAIINTLQPNLGKVA